MKRIADAQLAPLPELTLGEAVLRVLNPFDGVAGLLTEAMSLSVGIRHLENETRRVQRETRLRVLAEEARAQQIVQQIRLQAYRHLDALALIQKNVQRLATRHEELRRVMTQAMQRLAAPEIQPEDRSQFALLLQTVSNLLRGDLLSIGDNLHRVLASLPASGSLMNKTSSPSLPR